ncbi:nucleoside 2-deoxyribosyltransferase [Candidatus Woesearchaeota archaeon]|nr:nucleoside 2-deoxyribosyltransferase [Candidatus Woesearchaeota archaeon]
MKIYFAGSIRGGRNDKELYLKLIQHMQKYGEVLTEHVGNQELTQTGEDGYSDIFIYRRDMSWLLNSDVVVAEVSTPSLGVGYEIAKAEEMGKRILCLYKELDERTISSMISGNPHIKLVGYATLEDAIRSINYFFKSIK